MSENLLRIIRRLNQHERKTLETIIRIDSGSPITHLTLYDKDKAIKHLRSFLLESTTSKWAKYQNQLYVEIYSIARKLRATMFTT